MIVVEEVNNKLQKLPLAAQEEVLHFIEFMAQKFERKDDENKQWSEFSLNQAMRGMEDENTPDYTEADLKEKWR